MMNIHSTLYLTHSVCESLRTSRVIMDRRRGMAEDEVGRCVCLHNNNIYWNWAGTYTALAP